MSDARLRELERRWRDEGVLAWGARWLLARVREGALDPRRLALAALCGDPAARAALGEAAPPVPCGLRPLGARAEALVPGASLRAVAAWAPLLDDGAAEAVAASRAALAGQPLGRACAAWLRVRGLEEARVAEPDALVVFSLAAAHVEEAGCDDEALAAAREALAAWALRSR